MTGQGGIGRARPLRDCDLIMKGGISSGIVYPRAACQLSDTYRLRRVGGASAGAIAAALTAAAEHGRDKGGFTELETIPTKLGSSLAGLFQPSPQTKPAFSILLAWLEPRWSTGKKLWVSLLQIARQTRLALEAVTLLLLVPGFVVSVTSRGTPRDLGDWLGVAASTFVWLPGALAVGFVVAAVVFGRMTLRNIVANGYGLCNGHTVDPSVGQDPLTDWLGAQINSLAGLPADSRPLTIGDLWGRKAVALQAAIAEKDRHDTRVLPEERIVAAKARAVDLEVMTTNLTLRRPYKFPFSDRTFFFCPDCLHDYFAEPVVKQLLGGLKPVPDETDTRGEGEAQETTTISMKCKDHNKQLYAVPNAWDIPVVVAARISLSFPGLISAVPLFCVDRTRAFGSRELIQVWFSDGGISSNFPMHFFDTLWPTRPTFGINLSGQHPDFTTPVWRASAGASGTLPPSFPIETMPDFLTAIVRTMQNWVDNTQLTMPGFRDRIAVVRQGRGEGGLNLQMPSDVIEKLADRGADAAKLFGDFDFDRHRWIRYRVAMSEFDNTLTRMYDDYGPDGYEHFVRRYGVGEPSYDVGGRTDDPPRTRADRRADAACRRIRTAEPPAECRPGSAAVATPPIPTEAMMRTAAWIAALIGCGLILLRAGRRMATTAADLRQIGGAGIVAFELAGSTKRSREILTAWGPAGWQAARRNIHADFLFILGYTGVLAIPALVSADTIGRQTWAWTEGIGIAITIAVVLAGLLDVAEDVLLLSVLTKGSEADDLQPQARAAKVCAWIKFRLIAVAIAWLMLVAFPVVLTAAGTGS